MKVANLVQHDNGNTFQVMLRRYGFAEHAIALHTTTMMIFFRRLKQKQSNNMWNKPFSVFDRFILWCLWR